MSDELIGLLQALESGMDPGCVPSAAETFCCFSVKKGL
jgi:hypothetical protein